MVHGPMFLGFDLGSGLLGQVAGSGSNWVGGWGVGPTSLRLGPRQGEVIIRCHPHIKLLQHLSDWTAQKIH